MPRQKLGTRRYRVAVKILPVSDPTDMEKLAPLPLLKIKEMLRRMEAYVTAEALTDKFLSVIPENCTKLKPDTAQVRSAQEVEDNYEYYDLCRL